MNKQEFLEQLRKSLSDLPQDEVEECLVFYSEMIDDRMDEGVPEEDVICGIGNIDDIKSQMVVNIPIAKIAKERIKTNRRLKVWEIVLLTLGSPIWLSLGIVVFAVIFSLYISLWAVIISLWAVFASLVICSIGGVLACIILAIGGSGASGIVMLAAGIVCAGLSIFMFYVCKAGTKGILILTKKIAVLIKKCIIKKGAV